LKLAPLAVVTALVAACASSSTPRNTPQRGSQSTTNDDCADASFHAASQTSATPTVPTTCKTNDDCAMSTVRSCCSPCGLPPFADLKSEVDAVTKKCALVECAMRVPQECKPTESIDVYHAECQNAACVAVRNPPPPVTPTAVATLTSNEACSRDGDCVISNFGSCCSSCGASAYATSKRDLEARNRRCTIVDCAMDGRERCDPTIPASLYRAVCRSGSCAGVKR